ANIEFETDNKIEEAKEKMDLDVIMDDKDDIDSSQSRKKKDLSIIEEQFDNAEKHIEFGKKGGGKHMPDKVVELLKTFFHTGDPCELEVIDILKLSTIENWISRYSRQHK
ncbi:3843_t:CDS:2, partial [Entrophospora sp. SA101]